MSKRIPLAVIIISVVDIIVGLYYLVAPFFWIISGKISWAGLSFYILCSIIVIWVGVSTFHLKPKTVVINKVIAAVGIMAAFGSYGLLTHDKYFLGKPDKVRMLLVICSLVALYFIWAIAYLTRPKVKEQFK
jgi:hypothetical protein